MEHFDKQAKEWDNDPNKVLRAKKVAAEIKNFIKPVKNSSALEFGCGTGLLSYQLKDYFNTITLTDTSKGMIDVLQQKIKNENITNFNPLLINLLDEKLAKNNFDVIYTMMTLHHILDIPKILNIFNSLLNTHGYLCIADLVKEDGSFHANHPDFDGHNGFDKEELSNLLKANGFIVEYYNIYFEIEKEVNNKIQKYPLFLMICKKAN
ncbi:MAG: class I SAM-dependent methyltransferase [Lutibacter sp.]|uniref:class I SAM-dependent DNA methyltransferase n=1 Tax=Lutibacter sp. TaxID=1925666 RepID=UPI00299ED547|nr:class I SAM-dependent methyltransferase [Lutibacter sp.]MDX1829913.1 class I SAM-dependent methyltransferase [Lutibacter sp.]